MTILLQKLFFKIGLNVQNPRFKNHIPDYNSINFSLLCTSSMTLSKSQEKNLRIQIFKQILLVEYHTDFTNCYSPMRVILYDFTIAL